MPSTLPFPPELAAVADEAASLAASLADRDAAVAGLRAGLNEAATKE
jgi:hypothetical protein